MSGINIAFPLQNSNEGMLKQNKTTLDAIWEYIKTILLTRRGERVVNPQIGTNISIFGGELFNQINVEEMKIKIINEIKTVITAYLPQVKLNEVNIFTKETMNFLKDTQILVRMKYSLVNATNLNDAVQLTINT